MQGEGWLYSTRKKIRGSNSDPTLADPTLFGTRPSYSKVDNGLEAERVIQLFSSSPSFGTASPTGLFDSMPYVSPHSHDYPTRNLLEVRSFRTKHLNIDACAPDLCVRVLYVSARWCVSDCMQSTAPTHFTCLYGVCLPACVCLHVSVWCVADVLGEKNSERHCIACQPGNSPRRPFERWH